METNHVLFGNAQFIMGLREDRNLAGPRLVRLWQEVVSQRRTGCEFSLPDADQHIDGRHSAKTILKALESDGWYFVFDPGFSIVQLAQIFGYDPGSPPCRDRSNDGWMLDGNNQWTKETRRPGFYLVRTPVLCGLDLIQQDIAIRDLGGGEIERASSRLAVICGISHFLAFGNYGFGDCHHLGPETSDLGGVKTNNVVAFGEKGFALYNFPKGVSNKGIGVCLVRKFDP